MIYTYMTRLAIKIAYDAHKDQTDLSGIPYVFHPYHLAEQMEDEKTTIAALLHDVIEDSRYDLKDLEIYGFSPEIIEAVSVLTHDKNIDYDDYIKTISKNEIARKVKIADLYHNIDMTRCDEKTEKLLKLNEKYKKALDYLLSEKK